MRPWSPVPIEECGEPLQDLPREFLRMEPHPYMALGAPYGASGNPFQLRQGVVQRLLKAQQRLSDHDPSLRLSIFDAWRPIAVQAFMVEHSIADLCRERGVELMSGDAFDRVVADVAMAVDRPSRGRCHRRCRRRGPMPMTSWPPISRMRQRSCSTPISSASVG